MEEGKGQRKSKEFQDAESQLCRIKVCLGPAETVAVSAASRGIPEGSDNRNSKMGEGHFSNPGV